MIANLIPYPKMKNSGVEWLGDVPEHWEVHKLRSVLTGVTERNRPELPLLSVVREKGVILRDVANMDENHNFIPDDLTNYKVVHKGQFAMNKMKAWQGSYGVSRHAGIVSPAYFIFDISGVTRDYFHVAVRSKSYVPFFTQASDGVRIGQWDLSQVRMREIPLLVPSNTEQAAIVRFLDHADRRIRRYIRAKQKLTELLEEQKQAIIHQAVTGQIDVRTGQPYPAYKDSGVEWLGEVPEHWGLRRLRSLVSIETGGRDTVNRQDDGEYPFFVRSQTIERIDSWSFDGEAVLTAGDGVGVGKVFHYFSGKFDYHQRVYKFSDFRDILGRYFFHYLRSMLRHEVLRGTAKSTVDSLRLPMLQRFSVARPSLPEQSAIVSSIDKATANIESAIERARDQIDLLSEYRTRLIADVVTGKIDVREEEARLPEVDPLADEFDALTTQAAATGMMELEDATETLEEIAMENEATV